MSAPNWSDLREDGRVIVDAPARKLAVYSNPVGHVVLLSVDDGQDTYTDICPDEIPALLAALHRAAAEAIQTDRVLTAEYAAFRAIEKAQGN